MSAKSALESAGVAWVRDGSESIRDGAPKLARPPDSRTTRTPAAAHPSATLKPDRGWVAPPQNQSSIPTALKFVQSQSRLLRKQPFASARAQIRGDDGPRHPMGSDPPSASGRDPAAELASISSLQSSLAEYAGGVAREPAAASAPRELLFLHSTL